VQNHFENASIDGGNGHERMTSRPGGLAAWQRDRLFRHIEGHLAGKITRDELAKLVYMSSGSLSRRFKISAGVSPRQYIARRRAEMGRRMLESTREPLSQIAVACGLCDQAHFCRLFRRVFGVSPAAWRRARIIETASLPPRRSDGARLADRARHAGSI
jgi:AraC-like DNA-binding protein